MGSDLSKIDLSRENGNYKTKQKATVTVTSQDYTDDNKFKKYTQRIQYDRKRYSSWNGIYFHLSFSKREHTKRVYHYYVSNDSNIIEEIEVYFSQRHLDIPLILGFKTRSNDEFKYYKYTDLRDNVKSSTGLPKEQYLVKNLKTELISENEKRNKIKFAISGSSENYIEKIDDKNYGNFDQYKYYVDEQKTYKSYILSVNTLFKQENNNFIDTSFLKPLNDELFDFIYVYYFKVSKEVVLIEFVSDHTKKYFRRQDVDGKSWKDEELRYHGDSDVLKRKLAEIKDYYRKNVTYKLENNLNNNIYKNSNIKITSEKVAEYKYTLYKHTPTHPSHLNVTNVQYNNNIIKLVPNDNISRGQYKLDSLDKQIFERIDMYSFDDNQSEHLLMKLVSSRNKVYYFSRFSKDGTQWKQLGFKDLLELNLVNLDVLGVSRGGQQSEDQEKRLERELSDGNKTNNIKTLLQDISNTINSIIIVINYKNQYTKSNIDRTLGKNKDVAPIDVENYSIYVEGADAITDYCNKISGFDIYRHDLSKLGEISRSKPKPKTLYIRLYSNDKMIRLFDESKAESQPCYLTYLQGNTDLFVYFCESRNDPLLLLYNGICYRPKDKASKDTKWVKVEGIKNCKNGNQIKVELEKIKKELCPQVTTSSSNSTHGQQSNQGTSETSGAHAPLEPSGSSGIDPNQTTDQGKDKQTTRTQSPVSNPVGSNVPSGAGSSTSSGTQTKGNGNPAKDGLEVNAGPKNILPVQNTAQKETKILATSNHDRDHCIKEQLDRSENISSYDPPTEESTPEHSQTSSNGLPDTGGLSQDSGEDSSEGSIWEKIKNFFEEHQDAVLGASISVVGCGFCGYGLYLLLEKK